MTSSTSLWKILWRNLNVIIVKKRIKSLKTLRLIYLIKEKILPYPYHLDFPGRSTGR